MLCPRLTISLYLLIDALSVLPTTKNVAFILYLSSISKTLSVLTLGPSSKVKYAVF